MSKVLEYIIRAKDATGGAISSAISSVKNLATGIGRNLMNIQAGFAMLGGVARSAMEKLQKSFQFETMTVQFKRLVGGMEEAKEHMAMLQKMGDTPPFSLEQFAAASRSMLVMTDGVLGFEKSLTMVGDVAAGTGQPIESLAHEIGRAYAIIRDGQPLTRATMGLRNMGAITPEVAARLDELQKAGASNAQIWAELEKELGKFKGAMADTEETGEGLMGAISSQWDDTVRTFGGAVMETVKDGLQMLLAKLKDLNEDGTIEVWADKVGSAMREVAEALKTAVGWFGKVKDAYVWVRDGLEVVGAGVGSAVGALMSGDGMGEARQAFVRGMAEMAQEQDDRRTEDAKREEKVRAEVVRKRKVAEAAAEKKRLTEAEKVEKSMADARAKAQAKTERDRAAFKKSIEGEIAKAELDAQEKATMAEIHSQNEFAKRRSQQAEEYLAKLREVTDKAAKAELDAANSLANAKIDIEERIANERRKLIADELREKEKALRKEYDAQKKAQDDAKKRLKDAEEKEREAWGWYRDPSSMRAQLREERAEAKAQKRFEKDFRRLSRRSDWRDATNLSVRDEAVRRVAIAREEKEAAEKAALETAQNTKRTADALEAVSASLDEAMRVN